MTFHFHFAVICSIFLVVSCFFLYPLLGWLFGSYTVLRWRRLPLQVLTSATVHYFFRHPCCCCFARWLINPGDAGLAEHRPVHVVWFGGISLWSIFVRIALRRGLFLPEDHLVYCCFSPVTEITCYSLPGIASPFQRLEPIPTSLVWRTLSLMKVRRAYVGCFVSAVAPDLSGLSKLIERLEIQVILVL